MEKKCFVVNGEIKNNVNSLPLLVYRCNYIMWKLYYTTWQIYKNKIEKHTKYSINVIFNDFLIFFHLVKGN